MAHRRRNRIREVWCIGEETISGRRKAYMHKDKWSETSTCEEKVE
jgi:hypothetical protein